MPHETFVIGDIHGQYVALVRLLVRAGLVTPDLTWSGGKSVLWFMGDFFDRGPQAIEAVDLVMRLQREARKAGGQVGSLLGNHEVVMLSALWMGNVPCGGPGGTYRTSWLYNGGVESDLDKLRPEHIEWILSLPAMARAGDWLLLHMDSVAYMEYGSSVEQVNKSFRQLLLDRQPAAWDQLLGAGRHDFRDDRPGGIERLNQTLRTFGGRKLVHGHTCISDVTGQDPAGVTAPLVYSGGRCVNVDGGMYLGGPGFVYRL